MEPYVGEIRLFAGNFEPAGWMFCFRQELPIAEYEALFRLIGTTYGGNGKSTFCLPDLRGRVPIHPGGEVHGVLGNQFGVEPVTLTIATLPAHNHSLRVTADAATTGNPKGEFFANVSPNTFYGDSNANPTLELAPISVSASGGSHSHTNMMPFVALNYIISLFGTDPEQA
jgi:microcystin-dependent protein